MLYEVITQIQCAVAFVDFLDLARENPFQDVGCSGHSRASDAVGYPDQVIQGLPRLAVGERFARPIHAVAQSYNFV